MIGKKNTERRGVENVAKHEDTFPPRAVLSGHNG